MITLNVLTHGSILAKEKTIRHIHESVYIWHLEHKVLSHNAMRKVCRTLCVVCFATRLNKNEALRSQSHKRFFALGKLAQDVSHGISYNVTLTLKTLTSSRGDGRSHGIDALLANNTAVPICLVQRSCCIVA